MKSFWRAVALVFLLLFTGATAAPADAAPKRYAAVCGLKTWTGKDPAACKHQYTVYEITANRPRIVFQVTNGTKVDWNTVKKGYKAANKWCDENGIVCDVMIAVGVHVVLGWWAAAHS